MARWSQPDPAGGVGDYVYVGNDPVNFVDPTGLRRRRRPNIDYRHSECNMQTCLPRAPGRENTDRAASGDDNPDVVCGVDTAAAGAAGLPFRLAGGVAGIVVGGAVSYLCSYAR
jgi:hypothetical protein